MLITNLKHLEKNSDIQEVLASNKNVMISCGRMGPMCIPVYYAMEQLESRFTHVVFRDLEFDTTAADFIKNLPECLSFMGLPFNVYFKDGRVVAATTSIQSQEEIEKVLIREFGKQT